MENRQEDGIEELIPATELKALEQRIKWSSRLNVLLFFCVICASVFAFVAVGAHTYQYEQRLDRTVKEFKKDILALTGQQNIAINDLNRLVLDRDWINYQRLSLKQLQAFYNLREDEPATVIVVSNEKDEDVESK